MPLKQTKNHVLTEQSLILEFYANTELFTVCDNTNGFYSEIKNDVFDYWKHSLKESTWIWLLQYPKQIK